MRRLAGTGVWAGELRRFGDPGAITDAAGELEELGYSALWFPGGAGGDDVFSAAERLLAATRDATVATGILNLWMHDPGEVGAEHARLTAAHGDRFLVGVGVSHSPLVDASEPGRYSKPIETTRAYLDALDAATPSLPRDQRVLAALGPRMLELAATRSAGAHPYNVTPEHTASARAALGPGPLLLPEQAVLLETDPATARGLARTQMARYWSLPNYANNLRRLGFGDDDFGDGGSDRLIDAVIAWGDVETIARRVGEHYQAGADHVCIQVLHQGSGLPLTEWRELAPALV